jgi:molybdopterin molybdotransferase
MKPFGELTTRKDAMKLIEEKIKPINKVEASPLEVSMGRVLAMDIYAGFDVPPFDRASMDGYAVRSKDTVGASSKSPIKLKLVGIQHTGKVYNGIIGEKECIEIATGSPVPHCSDAVVKVEDTIIEDGAVLVMKPVAPGKDVAPAGEDMKKGDQILNEGVTLSPGMVGALAALGFKDVPVYSKPRIAIYSSGPEIVPQGIDLKPGQIYDINSFTITSVVSSNGCIPSRKGIMKDDVDSIKKAILDTANYDLGVFSGGSSVGSKDLFGEVMQDLGTVYFHGVKVKPGKPTLFGEVEGTPIFGMPGYPTSCLNNSYVYLTPALRKLARLSALEKKQITVPMGHNLVSKSDREQFITVRIGHGRAFNVFKQSGDITSMTKADGYIILPIGVNEVKEGETVVVTLLP